MLWGIMRLGVLGTQTRLCYYRIAGHESVKIGGKKFSFGGFKFHDSFCECACVQCPLSVCGASIMVSSRRDYAVVVAWPFGDRTLLRGCKLHPGRPMITPRVRARSLEPKKIAGVLTRKT